MEDTKVNTERGLRKTRTGIVVSDTQDKTLVIKVDRRTRHARYKKVITISKKYYAHDENNEAKIGDEVLISETRPYSKMKRWRLVEILKTAEK